MEIQNLTVKTKEGKIIINNLSLKANKGELVVIMGPSGSGKTTLMDLMTSNISSSLIYDGILKKAGSVKYVSQNDCLHGFYTGRQYSDHYIDLN